MSASVSLSLQRRVMGRFGTQRRHIDVAHTTLPLRYLEPLARVDEVDIKAYVDPGVRLNHRNERGACFLLRRWGLRQEGIVDGSLEAARSLVQGNAKKARHAQGTRIRQRVVHGREAMLHYQEELRMPLAHIIEAELLQLQQQLRLVDIDTRNLRELSPLDPAILVGEVPSAVRPEASGTLVIVASAHSLLLLELGQPGGMGPSSAGGL